jgi:hypothetical protein
MKALRCVIMLLPLALAARSRALHRIARGRRAAVVAILGQPRLQLLHAREHLRHLLRRVLVERVDACVLRFQFSDALVSDVHAPMLRLHRKSA